MTLESLDLSRRSYCCLRRAGIATLQELVGMTEKECGLIRSLGEKSLKEIKDKLHELGFDFKREYK